MHLITSEFSCLRYVTLLVASSIYLDHKFKVKNKLTFTKLQCMQNTAIFFSIM